MHELGIAQSIIDTVRFEAEKRSAKRVKEINVEVGELMQLDTNALSNSLKILASGSELEGAEIIVYQEHALFRCRRCGHEWEMSEIKKQLEQVPDLLLVREPDSYELPLHFLPSLFPSFVHCLNCGSADVATVKGEDVRLRKLVME